MSPSSPEVSVWGVDPWSLNASSPVRLLILALLSTQQSQNHNGEFDSHMSFLTASLINPMYNSALFLASCHLLSSSWINLDYLLLM